MNKKSFKFYKQILIVVIISILVGFGAGLVGQLWLNDFLLTGTADDQKIETLTQRLNALTEKQEKKLKDILAEKDISISQTIESVRPALVKFYLDKSRIGAWSDIMLDNEFIGSGIVLTADGWILTDKKVVTENRAELVVSFEKDIYQVESFVCDTSTDACFVKIKTDNLPVANLTNRDFLTSGQTALIVSTTEIFPSSIECLYYNPINKRGDLIHSSETYYKNIALTDVLDKKWLGAPVVNLNGQVFGIVTSDNLVIPIDNIQSIIKQAISESTIARNILGIHYIDLSEAIGWEKYAEQNKGALIFGAEGKVAVLSDSPAQKAGLMANDIILEIEGEIIKEENSLTNIIQSYKPEQELTFTILREEKEIEINLSLTK